VRRLLGLILLLMLMLAGCAETPTPTVPPAAIPTAAPPTEAAPTPMAAPSKAQAIPPTAMASPSPTLAPPLPPASGGEGPWPTFLRELNFGIAAGNSYGPRAVAVHPGLDRLYVRTRSPDYDAPGQVTVLDRSSGQVLAIVETGLDSYADGAVAVDGKRDRVYAVDAGEAACSVFGADSLKPLTTLMGVDLMALDVDGGQLYVAGLAGLRILDAAQYDVLQELPIFSASRFLALAVDPVGGRIYLAYEDDGGYVLSQYDAASLEALASSELPGRPEALVVDPNRERAYLTLNDGERSLLWVVDGAGRTLDERDTGEWTQKNHLALDPEGDRLFVGREVYDNNGITILDLESGQEVADIPLELSPNALTWDAEASRLWVSHTYADRISVVDVEAGESLAIFPTALDLVSLAVDPERGYLYVTDTAGRLHVLDSETDEELATLPGEGRVAVDSHHARLYTGGEGAERVRVFDAETLGQTGEIDTTAKPVADAYHGSLYLVQAGVYLASLETMTVTTAISDTLPEYPGYSPNPAAVDAVVDPGSGRLYAIINNGVPGSNNGNYLYVYEPVTYERVFTDTERSPIYVDVDPITGQAYVSRVHLAGRSTSLLKDGREYTARLDAAFGALRVDPDLGSLYLSVQGNEEGYLLVLDTENLDVLGSVPIPGGFSLRALDPQRHLLYLATQDGLVQIWSATGGEPAEPVEPATVDLPPEEIYRLFRGPGDRPLFTGSLYRSDDEGRSWQRINNGLPLRGVQELAVSPDFAHDETLFTALFATDEGLGIWQSSDGGRSWRMASRGLGDLAVGDLAISPNFASDQTLFATARRGGLYRSTDGGQTWQRLTDRYLPQEPYPQAPQGVCLSPTYAQDHTLFVLHEGLHRSIDGGETWSQSLADMSSLDFSPDFARDRTLFGWSGQGGVLRSTDGGETWKAANVGLATEGYGTGRVVVSPDFPTSRTLYFLWTPSALDGPVQFFRSTDAAETWERLAGEPPQAATPVELSADGTAFLALAEGGQLVRWPVAELAWQPMARPRLEEIEIYRLVLSPKFVDDQTLYAMSEGAGILRSSDAGVTWTDTGFPVRMTLGTLPELVITPTGIRLVGTPLGLYRSDEDGAWTPVGSGLPPGIATTSPEIGADGSLRILAGGVDFGQEIFLSTDGGETWNRPAPTLPMAVNVEDVQLSPAFATDHTATVAQIETKPLRSIGGGAWEEFGPAVKSNPSALQLSPAFDRDGLIFVRLQDNTLWRSTDGGDGWTNIGGPWGGEAPRAVTQGTGYRLDALTFSPAFDGDGVMLTEAGNTVYRSTDEGTTWTRVLDLEPAPVQAMFTPRYALDGIIYLLQGRTLYRSTDRGQRWQALPAAPWGESDETKLLLSPTFSEDNTLLVWTRDGRVYQSRDGGQSWLDISNGLPAVGIRQVLFSPGHETDGLLFLVPHSTPEGGGLYKRVGDRPWTASTDSAPAPTPEARPTATPASTGCASEPARFLAVWQQASTRLGCPTQAAEQVTLAEQPFEHGRMIWDSSTGQIYVLGQAGTWQAFDDSFVEGLDQAWDPALPPPPQQPQRGFGKVWREQLGGTQASIGWALENERAVSGWRQPFDRGLLVWTDATLNGATGPGTATLLYDDGAWQAISAPAP
jgi:photosystem II stability/assembly factor-like uncharacterized protein/DNA-binding beta-propeller fold protein YncE